ncbi:MAG: TIGR00282 family metallophosphoesterase [Clostridia bacterium]|jgi:putative metallophosphoesterase|uniref:TIGR00282 family metallophosphoesterase n=1 Tax=Candidatus Merdicola sp. TaxID=3085652 RepID=UPI003A22383F
MNILAIGDIVGEIGVKKIVKELPKLKEKYDIDFCIINGENSAGGMGITKKIFDSLINAGADVITMGNHTWGKKDIFSFIDDKRIVRPANYTKGLPGNDYSIVNKNNKRIAVINLIGRTSMGILSENPFIVANDIYNKLKNQADIFVLDFHAEATAEKIAMGYYMDGKYTIVYGTHTHVQTADEQMLEKGTAYITDIGMTGPKKSVIGMDVGVSFKRFVTSLPERYKLADSEAMINGCVFKINDETNRTEEIIRINTK